MPLFVTMESSFLRSSIQALIFYSALSFCGQAVGIEEALPENKVTISACKNSPKVDGTLSPGEWDKAAGVTGFINNHVRGKGVSAKNQTQVYLTYDDRRLYFAFVSPVPAQPPLRADVKSRDGQVWTDDSLEIFICPKAKREEKEPIYFQFVGNSAGIYYDARGKDPSWNGQWEYKSVIHDQRWIAEASISFSDVGAGKPADGETWRINLCRSWQNPREWTSWSQGVNFHDTSKFGYLTFQGRGPVVRVDSFGSFVGRKIAFTAHVVTTASTIQPGSVVGLITISPLWGDVVEEYETPLSWAEQGGTSGFIAFDQAIKNEKAEAMIFTVASADKTHTYLQTSVPLTVRDELLISV